MLYQAQESARRAAAGAALVGAALGVSSCYLTSSFDGLTPDTGGGAKGGAETSGGAAGSGGSAASAGGGTAGAGPGGAAGSATSSSAGAGPGGSAGSGGATGGTGGGGDPPFPATPILDDFNQPDGEPGFPWQPTFNGSYVISANQLAANDKNPLALIWGNHFGTRQEVYVTLKSFLSQDEELEIIMRNQDNPSECDSLVASYNAFGALTKRVGVAYCKDNMWTGVGEVEVTLDPGDQLGMRGYDDGTVKVYRNGLEIGSWDASGWEFGKSGGRIGIFSYGLTSAVLYDDFGGGNF